MTDVQCCIMWSGQTHGLLWLRIQLPILHISQSLASISIETGPPLEAHLKTRRTRCLLPFFRTPMPGILPCRS